jgi:hypothetical protein
MAFFGYDFRLIKRSLPFPPNGFNKRLILEIQAMPFGKFRPGLMLPMEITMPADIQVRHAFLGEALARNYPLAEDIFS